MHYFHNPTTLAPLANLSPHILNINPNPLLGGMDLSAFSVPKDLKANPFTTSAATTHNRVALASALTGTTHAVTAPHHHAFELSKAAAMLSLQLKLAANVYPPRVHGDVKFDVRDVLSKLPQPAPHPVQQPPANLVHLQVNQRTNAVEALPVSANLKKRPAPVDLASPPFAMRPRLHSGASEMSSNCSVGSSDSINSKMSRHQPGKKKRKLCNFDGCGKFSRGVSGFCVSHGGGARCRIPNCTKSAVGKKMLCKGHGGGKRCQHPACTKSAVGATSLCKAHGGGTRCTFPNCGKSAEGSDKLCKRHGGGKRCQHGGCSKSARGKTNFCIAHGGGKRCIVADCPKSAQGKTDYCVAHGGGRRCRVPRCTSSSRGTGFCRMHSHLAAQLAVADTPQGHEQHHE